MRNFTPSRPTGDNPEARFMQAVWDAVFGAASKLNSSSTVKVSRTSKGTSFTAAAGSPGGGSSNLYKITTIYYAEYFGATKWDATVDNGDGTFGATVGSEIQVAKCIGGRMPLAELIDETLITYLYYDDGTAGNLRKASSVGYADEWHVVHPRYDSSDLNPSIGIVNAPGLVIVERSQNPTGVLDMDGNPIYYIETSPQRNWAYQQDQSGFV
jgi:hypothetical protein